jgi:hypothetical protein
MTKRADIAPRVPLILALPIEEAAVSIGVSETHYRAMMDCGMMPIPRDVNGVPSVDVEELAKAFRALPYWQGKTRKADIPVDNWDDGAVP